jgi:plastocyanin
MNDNHSLRIPNDVRPWAFGFLLPVEQFEVKLTVEGVHDRVCAPHKMAEMAGRRIIGHPDEPGALPFDHFRLNARHG